MLIAFFVPGRTQRPSSKLDHKFLGLFETTRFFQRLKRSYVDLVQALPSGTSISIADLFEDLKAGPSGLSCIRDLASYAYLRTRFCATRTYMFLIFSERIRPGQSKPTGRSKGWEIHDDPWTHEELKALPCAEARGSRVLGIYQACRARGVVYTYVKGGSGGRSRRPKKSELIERILHSRLPDDARELRDVDNCKLDPLDRLTRTITNCSWILRSIQLSIHQHKDDTSTSGMKTLYVGPTSIITREEMKYVSINRPTRNNSIIPLRCGLTFAEVARDMPYWNVYRINGLHQQPTMVYAVVHAPGYRTHVGYSTNPALRHKIHCIQTTSANDTCREIYEDRVSKAAEGVVFDSSYLEYVDDDDYGQATIRVATTVEDLWILVLGGIEKLYNREVCTTPIVHSKKDTLNYFDAAQLLVDCREEVQ